MVGFWFEFKNSGRLDCTLCYLGLKLSLKVIMRFLQVFKRAESSKISIEYFYCCALQCTLFFTIVLLSVYLSVFNFSLFYFSSFLAFLSLIRNKKVISVLIVSLFILWISANFDTIKSKIQLVDSSNFTQILQNLSFNFIKFIKTLSL